MGACAEWNYFVAIKMSHLEIIKQGFVNIFVLLA